MKHEILLSNYDWNYCFTDLSVAYLVFVTGLAHGRVDRLFVRLRAKTSYNDYQRIPPYTVMFSFLNRLSTDFVRVYGPIKIVQEMSGEKNQAQNATI